MPVDPPIAPPPSAAPGRSRPAIAAGLLALLVGGLALVAFIVLNFVIGGGLPGCDARATRDSLSTIFRENSIEATGYEDTRELARSESEITCAAVLALQGGAKLDLSYRVVREGDRMLVRATWRRREGS